jgi:hypothetical protein
VSKPCALCCQDHFFFYSNGKQISGIHLEYGIVSKNNIYKTAILTMVLYGCETCSLTLREEDRLRVIENRVLRGIFGQKRDEVTVEENCIMRSFIITCILCQV